jgi:hypothetical protein
MFSCCCLGSRNWIIKLVFFLSFYFFLHLASLSLFFFFPSVFFLRAFCLVALPRDLTLLPQRLVLLLCYLFVPCATSSYYLIALSCYLNLLPNCLVVPNVASNYLATSSYLTLLCYLHALHYLTIWLPLHLKYLLTPPNLLLCYLIALRLATSLPCVNWYFLPPSYFVGRRLEFAEANFLTKEG